MTTARLEVRIDEKSKTIIEKASALSGAKSLTAYIVNQMVKNATRVIAKHEKMTIENDIFDRFMDACANASKPNKALLDAAKFTKTKGIK